MATTLFLVIATIAVMVLVAMLIIQKTKSKVLLNQLKKIKKHWKKKKKFSTKRLKLEL